MITLSPPDHRLPHELFEAPGGFVWWYLDLVNEAGDGIVLIWSWGLPFLPGYASATRRGQAQLPKDRPSLNICLYREGELDFYLLQEYAPEEANWDGEDLWRFGRSTFVSKVVDGRRVVEIELNCQVPGQQSPLRGTVEIEGPARLEGDGERVNLDHDWSPLVGPARGRVDLRTADEMWRFKGRGYHDRNGGRIPMHDIEFSHWLWGRIPFEDREIIYYLLWPRDESEPIFMGLEIDADGETTIVHDLGVELGGPQRSLPGLKWHRAIRLVRDGKTWLDIVHVSVVDDGPFYMRYQSIGSRGLQTGRGFGEYVVPENIDLDLHRPLVNMRVHKADGSRNSMWLPLFTGSRDGRVRRLMKTWLGVAT